jgi:4-hydroxybenzoate polyprenyltransferase
LRIKKYRKIVKPSFKGGLMVLFGIFNSRLGIGIEIFTVNLIYGPLAYLFIAFSGIIIIKLLQMLSDLSSESKKSIKRAILVFVALYLIGFILIICNVIENMMIYYFNTAIIIFTVFIGIIWCLFGFFGFKNRKNIKSINILMVTLIFSIGLIFGAFLNTYLIPHYIYFFFFSISFLQLSRELMKGFNEGDKIESFIMWEIHNNKEKILRYSLVLDLLAIVFLLLTTFSNIIYPLLFLVLIVSNIIIISLAMIFTLESILIKKVEYKISTILKIGIFIELLTLLIIGS